MMSRTGGLLELFPDKSDAKNPWKMRVDYMYRTTSDWAKKTGKRFYRQQTAPLMRPFRFSRANS